MVIFYQNPGLNKVFLWYKTKKSTAKVAAQKKGINFKEKYLLFKNPPWKMNIVYTFKPPNLEWTESLYKIITYRILL